MESLGHLADVTSFISFKFEMITHYDVFIFHRPPDEPKLVEALDLIEKQRKLVFADYDDLIFSPEHALDSPLYKSRVRDKRKVIDLFQRNYNAMKQFEHVVVSTTPLAESVCDLVKEKCVSVNVIHNGLSSPLMKAAVTRKLKIPSSKKRISYLSGTATHDHDFKIVHLSLEKALARLQALELMIVGDLNYDKKMLAHKVKHFKSVPYEILPDYIEKAWLNIAPLEDNVFNRCKSGLKFFESAIFGIPSIVSPIPDFTRFTGSGIKFAESDSEWESSIEQLYCDACHYDELSNQVKDYALSHCGSLEQTRRFLNLSERLLA